MRSCMQEVNLLYYTGLTTNVASGHEFITPDDVDNMRAFNLKITSGMSRESFKLLQRSFAHKMDIDSEFRIVRRMSTLTEIQIRYYDCCINSCILFVLEYKECELCPHCNEERFDSQGKARQRFGYIPLIPRLQGYFQNCKLIELMSYRSEYKQSDDSISDIFDSDAYRTLCSQDVEADGRKIGHKFFSDPRDIALSLCIDSFLLFKRRRGGPSGTPILLKNHNVPPWLNNQLKYLICVGLISGPKQPKELRTFLMPLEEELVQLAHGVPTFDCTSEGIFDLHAYDILQTGDMVSIEKFLGIKGHNAIFPCRSCRIQAVRDTSLQRSPYYAALTHPIKTKKP